MGQARLPRLIRPAGVRLQVAGGPASRQCEGAPCSSSWADCPPREVVHLPRGGPADRRRPRAHRHHRAGDRGRGACRAPDRRWRLRRRLRDRPGPAPAGADGARRLGQLDRRDAGRLVAGRRGRWVRAVEVEVVCSDVVEHRRRAELRTIGVPGLPCLSWSSIAARHYEPWPREHVVLDTAGKTLDEAAAVLLAAMT